MKTELIKYHREMSNDARSMLRQHEGAPVATKMDLEDIEFHERAVAWLESLDEGLAISASAERQIQRENLERLNRQVNG